jgi:hypothetical protein
MSRALEKRDRWQEDEAVHVFGLKGTNKFEKAL